MKSLQAFTNLAELLQGSISHSFLLQIHAQILLQGAHQDNLIATRLIGHYPSQSALCVFHQLRSPNIFPFNAIIRVLSEEGLSFQVFSLFRVLKRRSLSPNDFTFSFLLKACLRSGDDGLFVRQAHAHILKVGSNFDSFVCNGLLSVYAKGVGDLSSASKLFDEMPDKGMVCCWTSLIAGFAQSGKAEEALELFFRMVSQRLRPDSDTMVNVLSACASLKMEDRERWVKILSVNDGDSAHQSFNNDSINMVLSYLYGRLGSTEKSRESFDRITMMGKRNIIAWNTMINAYVQNGWTSEALSLFRLMMQDPFLEPNHVSMVSVLSACAEVGDIHLGTMVDEYMKLKGHKERVKTNSILATAVIDMYCKCGNLRRAKEVFNDMVVKDVVAINAMIMGLATNGEGAEALRLFQETQDLGFHPNHGTFLSVLCACCHSGMLEEGRQIFQDMNTRFSVLPQLEHYASYIDLLSRFGHIEEALEVVASMPFKPNGFVWSSLLGGCLRHSRLKFIQELSRRLVEEDVENSAGFVLWSNALALDFQWGKVSELRTIMKDKGVKKQSGSSWISINGVTHEFLAGPTSHPEIYSICHILDRLVKEMRLLH
ncbi:hypothetical protein Dimus_003050 [Dionaea muscipula]